MADSNTRYWCYLCERVVDPIRDPEVKCSICDSGFIEEMNPGTDIEPASNLRSGRSLSLWAPVLLGMTGPGNGSHTNTSGFRHFRTHNRELEEADDDLDQEFENFIRRRRRRSAVRQLLHILREESETRSNQDRERNRDLERERTSLLISAFNQAIGLQGNSSSSLDLNPSSSSLEDYGPGLDHLLQHLVENDPSRYGTPPAKKEAVEALPSVIIEEFSLACSVCLDEFETGSEAKLLPCKHKFHGKCIMPWLELHCSCPICRFELPTNDSKDSSGESSGSGARDEYGGVADDDGTRDRGNTANDGVSVNSGNNDSNNRPWILMPWPFNNLFSMSGSRNSADSSSGNGGNANSDEN
jgi:E3 ubiquitin-protein ligase RNF115/126